MYQVSLHSFLHFTTCLRPFLYIQDRLACLVFPSPSLRHQMVRSRLRYVSLRLHTNRFLMDVAILGDGHITSHVFSFPSAAGQSLGPSSVLASSRCSSSTVLYRSPSQSIHPVCFPLSFTQPAHNEPGITSLLDPINPHSPSTIVHSRASVLAPCLILTQVHSSLTAVAVLSCQ